ncbi:MAG: hypothetical protein HYS21_02570 [Deltaproteobacteria bacterium]|nr:hypothetical protein [Deltaproteobacteria bacterium]
MKNLLTILASGFFLMFFYVAAYATESENQLYNDLLPKYKDYHQEVILELKNTKKVTAEIVKLMQEASKLDQLIAKNIKNGKRANEYREKYESLINSLYEKFGIYILIPSYHFQNFNIETASEQQIKDIFDKTISLYSNSLDCFNQKTFSSSKICNDFKKICSNYGSENGDMYYYELNKDIELKKIDVSEADPDLINTADIKGATVFFNDMYQFCRLITITTSSPFSPLSIKKNDSEMDPYFIKDFHGSILPFRESFEKICINEKPSEQRIKRLLDLKSRFPENWRVNEYYSDYEKWKPACNKAAQNTCKNTYIIKDKIILTYPTVACTNREVTREDIENDISLMESNADKLKHSTLLDEIDTCQKAHNNGFFWFYEEPTSSDKCKKEPPKTPKKRK